MKKKNIDGGKDRQEAEYDRSEAGDPGRLLGGVVHGGGYGVDDLLAFFSQAF